METRRAIACHYGFKHLVSTDVGGTPTDIGEVRDGVVRSHLRGRVENVSVSFLRATSRASAWAQLHHQGRRRRDRGRSRLGRQHARPGLLWSRRQRSDHHRRLPRARAARSGVVLRRRPGARCRARAERGARACRRAIGRGHRGGSQRHGARVGGEGRAQSHALHAHRPAHGAGRVWRRRPVRGVQGGRRRRHLARADPGARCRVLRLWPRFLGHRPRLRRAAARPRRRDAEGSDRGT
ncbi:MAG: hypothetical protein IPG43_04685 [Proteobacteria bacterium]|nr:hypothetical protein [Pseudomonadota bacterium]